MKFALTGLFILALSLLFFGWLYDYPAMLHLLPQGSHIWRQADCVAMAENYRQFHLPFLQPEVYNLQSTNGKVAGEFPIFYFLAAQFANVTFALRCLHTFVFIAGIIGVYFVALYFLQRRFLTLIACWFLCTSPLLVFYGNNFLSDVPALSMAFIGWAFFLYGNKKERFSFLIIAFLFFALAALLKASEYISFVLAFLFLWKFKKLSLKTITLFFIAIIPLAWYGYARRYNIENHDTYYFLSVAPIWKLSLYNIGLGAWRMLVSLSNNYFWRPTSVLLIVASYYVFKHRKRLDADLRWMIISSGMMVFLYILFFYEKMLGHEYYYIPFFLFFLFLLIGILKTYNCFHAENVFTHAPLFLFMIPNMFFCKNFVSKKINDSHYNAMLSSKEIQSFLIEHRVDESKSILSLPDDSPNKTLFLLKRKGYTAYNDYKKILKEKKADYLLLSDKNAETRKEIQPYLADSIADYKGVTLYKLK